MWLYICTVYEVLILVLCSSADDYTSANVLCQQNANARTMQGRIALLSYKQWSQMVCRGVTPAN